MIGQPAGNRTRKDEEAPSRRRVGFNAREYLRIGPAEGYRDRPAALETCHRASMVGGDRNPRSLRNERSTSAATGRSTELEERGTSCRRRRSSSSELCR